MKCRVELGLIDHGTGTLTSTVSFGCIKVPKEASGEILGFCCMDPPEALAGMAVAR